MKSLSIALLALIASLSLTGCSSSPSEQEIIKDIKQEIIKEIKSEYESKLERYEDCLRQNAVLSKRAEEINKFLTEPYKKVANLEIAFSYCAQYRP